MLNALLARALGLKPLVVETKVFVDDAATKDKKEKHPLGPLVHVDTNKIRVSDPLSMRSMGGSKFDDMQLVTPSDIQSDVRPTLGPSGYVGDSMVTGQGGPMNGRATSAYTVPDAVQSWYSSQSFIGHQTCAIMAQHWLMDKACSMPGEDAVRNGYSVTIKDADEQHPDDTGLDSETIISQIEDLDNDFNISDELVQFWRFTQIFGVRVCVFDVVYEDPRAIELPFNIDGVAKDSYRGIRQVDPYWCMPVVTGTRTSDPASPDFYEPEFWNIGGKKYHKSHLVIGRGAEPADILKPTYIYGGVPLVQQLWERVYAAERTANEGPMLALTKRTSVLKADLALAETQPERFMGQLNAFAMFRDNYGIKVIDTEDSVEQFDTSLADLDSVIMNQYQLVAAISCVPATKLLGTSPKGFSSTGEFETVSYHEHLESVQKFLSRLLRRHHELVCMSTWGVDLPISHTWKRVGSLSEIQLAELNSKKIEGGDKLIANGSISPDEERNRLKNDPLSGYGHLSEDSASEEMGGSPENEAEMEKAQSQEMTAEAHAMTAEKKPEDDIAAATDSPEGETLYADAMSKLSELTEGFGDSNLGLDEETLSRAMTMLNGLFVDTVDAAPGSVDFAEVNAQLDAALASLSTLRRARGTQPGVKPSVLPSVQPSVRAGDTSAAGLPAYGGVEATHRKMPKHSIKSLPNIVVENPAGSVRAGTTVDGVRWRNQMAGDYGFFEGTVGADGDDVDVMLGPDRDVSWAYIINQIEPTTGKFDEHKVYIGYRTEGAAREAYRKSYQDGWAGLSSIHRVTIDELRDWMRSGPCDTPYL